MTTTDNSLRPLRVSFPLLKFLFLLLICNATRAQTTAPDSTLLRVHVTAVQGQAQFRPYSTAKWQPVTVGLDTLEGAEFRTGPKGVIQFTVGTDQVYRVDRLTVIKLLRANLNANGSITTDVGMTYGRVSKDVDLPAAPHDDKIVTPSSTLAVRGTEVSMFDNAPYPPEAQSLTGKAIYHNSSGQQFAFGSKNGGTNKVTGDTVGAAQTQLNTGFVDPDGSFSGHTAAEVQNIQNTPGAPPPGPTGTISQHTGQIIGGTATTGDITGTLVSGSLLIAFGWQSNTQFSVVELSFKDPKGNDFTSAHVPAVPPTPQGPFYFGSNIGNLYQVGMGFINGNQGFSVGRAADGVFQTGDYAITVTLQGTETQLLSQVPTEQITGQLSVTQFSTTATSKPHTTALHPSVGDPPPIPKAFTQPFVLDITNPTATFIAPTPVHDQMILTPTHPH